MAASETGGVGTTFDGNTRFIGCGLLVVKPRRRQSHKSDRRPPCGPRGLPLVRGGSVGVIGTRFAGTHDRAEGVTNPRKVRCSGCIVPFRPTDIPGQHPQCLPMPFWLGGKGGVGFLNPSFPLDIVTVGE